MSISLQWNLAIQIQVTRRPREINLCLLTSCCFPNQQDHKNIIGDFSKGTESTGCLVFLVSLSGVVVTSQCGGPNSYQKWSGRMITLSHIYILYKLMIIIGCTVVHVYFVWHWHVIMISFSSKGQINDQYSEQQFRLCISIFSRLHRAFPTRSMIAHICSGQKRTNSMKKSRCRTTLFSLCLPRHI